MSQFSCQLSDKWTTSFIDCSTEAMSKWDEAQKGASPVHPLDCSATSTSRAVLNMPQASALGFKLQTALFEQQMIGHLTKSNTARKSERLTLKPKCANGDKTASDTV